MGAKLFRSQALISVRPEVQVFSGPPASSELGGRKMEQIRKILIKPGESGFWIAECPSLPGCISQGHSKDEAIQNIKEAIQAYIEVLSLTK